MKRLTSALLLCAFSVLLLAGTAQAQLRVGLRLYGGLNYLSGGDLNTGSEGWFDYYREDILSAYSTSDKFSPLHLGFDFGGDLILQFTPQLGIGIGAGYITASKTFTAEFTHVGWNPITYTNKPTMGAIPIRLSFYYFLPVGSNFNVYFQLGGAYYIASMKLNFKAEMLGYYEDYEYETTGGGLGFHGGLGLEIALSPMISLIFDVTGRFANFANFKGDFAYSEPGYSISENDIDLYHFTALDPGFGSFNLLYLTDTAPSGPGISGVRKAKIDFSGISAFLGFLFRF